MLICAQACTDLETDIMCQIFPEEERSYKSYSKLIHGNYTLSVAQSKIFDSIDKKFPKGLFKFNTILKKLKAERNGLSHPKLSKYSKLQIQEKMYYYIQNSEESKCDDCDGTNTINACHQCRKIRNILTRTANTVLQNLPVTAFKSSSKKNEYDDYYDEGFEIVTK